MASNALVQTRIDADVKEKATAVLEDMGSDGVRRRADPAVRENLAAVRVQ
jgi:hypothetical protein